MIKCNDKNNIGKIQNFIKSTKTNSAKGNSGATSFLPPIGSIFMYIGTSSKNHGKNVFVSFEGIDISQISTITFYYNGFSILPNNSLKAMGAMGRFRLQSLLENNTWSTRYNISIVIDIVILQLIGL